MLNKEEVLDEVLNRLPPGLRVVAKLHVKELRKEIEDLQTRCDNLQSEVNALENPPHQLCGHSPERCTC